MSTSFLEILLHVSFACDQVDLKKRARRTVMAISENKADDVAEVEKKEEINTLESRQGQQVHEGESTGITAEQVPGAGSLLPPSNLQTAPAIEAGEVWPFLNNFSIERTRKKRGGHDERKFHLINTDLLYSGFR